MTPLDILPWLLACPLNLYIAFTPPSDGVAHLCAAVGTVAGCVAVWLGAMWMRDRKAVVA